MLLKNIAFLALTIHSDEAYIMKMINAGALGYILKDSDREVLIDAVKTVYRNDKYYSNKVSLKLISLLTNKKKTHPLQLSEREKQILKLFTKGDTNLEIGEKLSISSRTVESHRRNIIKKLNLKNTAELIKYALSNSRI